MCRKHNEGGGPLTLCYTGGGSEAIRHYQAQRQQSWLATLTSCTSCPGSPALQQLQSMVLGQQQPAALTFLVAHLRQRMHPAFTLTTCNSVAEAPEVVLPAWIFSLVRSLGALLFMHGLVSFDTRLQVISGNVGSLSTFF